MENRPKLTAELSQIADLIDLAQHSETTTSQRNLLLESMDFKIQKLISKVSD